MTHMPIDPRTVVHEQIGTRLRDAAVDPRPHDYGRPSNAGKPGDLGNPHGPHVVAGQPDTPTDNTPEA